VRACFANDAPLCSGTPPTSIASSTKETIVNRLMELIQRRQCEATTTTMERGACECTCTCGIFDHDMRFEEVVDLVSDRRS